MSAPVEPVASIAWSALIPYAATIAAYIALIPIAGYLITTPVTHNANVFAPAQLTLVTRKKQPGSDWAPPIGVLQRAVD